MRRHPRSFAIWGMGLVLGLAQAGLAQVAPPAPGQQPDINNLSHQMAEQVRILGEDIASDLGQTPQGRHLLQDLQELAQAVEGFHESLHNVQDPYARRQAYTGIDQTWHHLKGRLAQYSSPAVDRAAQRVENLDQQIHQALGMRPLPQGYYGGPAGAPPAPPAGPPPVAAGGFSDTQRLAYSMTQRAESLASVVQSQAGQLPGGGRYVQQAQQLSQACGGFYDTLRQDQRPEAIQQAFLSVATIADRLETDLQAAGQLPPPIDQGWQSFASTEILIRRQLNLPTPPPQVHIDLNPVGGGPSPVVGMAGQLVQQVDGFLGAFGPTAGAVPEGERFLADAQRLREDAVNFHQDCQRGLDPNRLAAEFREVDASWQRLARRIQRVAQGRTGPNIQQVMQIGETCAQIHQVLGMPGYPPTFGPGGHGHGHE